MLLAPQIDPHISVARLLNLVRQYLDVVLNLRRSVLAPDQPLDSKHRVLRVRDRLALGDLTHQPLSAFGHRHDRRRRAPSLRIGDHLGVTALHDRHTTVRRAQIDSDYLAHLIPPSKSRYL